MNIINALLEISKNSTNGIMPQKLVRKKIGNAASTEKICLVFFVAADPSMSMIDIARNLHPHPGIHWVRNRLPELDADNLVEAKFDMILCNAVWMHIAPNDRINALKRIRSLLAPGGSVFIAVRLGPENKDRGAWALSISDFIGDMQDSGLKIALTHDIEDLLKRPEISWKAFEIKHSGPDYK